MRPRAQKWRVCPHVDKNGSCPELVNAQNPCPKHGRPNTSPWSKHRSPDERRHQAALRKAALARANHTCERCGHHDPTGKSLQVHHMRATQDYNPAHAQLLCRDCHRAVDHWAR